MKLVTIAAFNQPVPAEMMKSVLEEEGIWAVIADSEVAQMELLLTNAIGGIKVQVHEDDAERALEFLRNVYGYTGSSFVMDVDEEELARQALEAEPDENEEPPPPPEAQPDEPVKVQRGYEDTREQYARRFMLSTLFSIALLPLFFYSIYLMLNVLFGQGPLSRKGRWHFIIGCLLFIPFLLAFLAITGYWGLAEWFFVT